LWLEVSKADLRAASRAGGGSMNDGFLSAVCAGVRLYHDRLGVPVESIPIAIPISLRRPKDPDAANRWAGARLVAPVSELDPRVRIDLLREQVIQARQEPALEAMSVAAPIAAKLPPWLLAVAAGNVSGGHDLQISNVPGSPIPMYLAGAKVEAMIPFGPVPGPAAMITIHSYTDTCFVGINLDPAAITEPELFASCLDEGIAEILALLPDVAADASSG
jgi:hypothetical protein